MARPHTLKVGDTVTSDQWPLGTKRNVIAVYPAQRGHYVKGRHKLFRDPHNNIVVLDAWVFPEGVRTENPAERASYTRWMEVGLEKVS